MQSCQFAKLFGKISKVLWNFGDFSRLSGDSHPPLPLPLLPTWISHMGRVKRRLLLSTLPPPPPPPPPLPPRPLKIQDHAVAEAERKRRISPINKYMKVFLRNIFGEKIVLNKKQKKSVSGNCFTFKDWEPTVLAAAASYGLQDEKYYHPPSPFQRNTRYILERAFAIRKCISCTYQRSLLLPILATFPPLFTTFRSP